METFLSTYAFIFGCLIGSFLNVVILRLPKGTDLVRTRSHCPQCGAQLKWFHNIPILSFLFLRAKCGFCGARISWRYPLIELATGLIALWLAPTGLSPEVLAMFFFHFAIACIFICHFFIDLDHHLLLDSLNLYLLSIILPYCLFLLPWTYWVSGGVIGFGFPLAITWAFYKLRGQVGLGGGDIKLFGILGLLFGPAGIMLNIFLSCFVGALVGIILIALKKMNKEHPLAFGPAILLVASLQIFFPVVMERIQGLLF